MNEYANTNTIEPLPESFSVCKVSDYSGVDIDRPFVFTGCTDQEKSLVCPTGLVPANTVSREDGWRGFRILAQMDFSLIGILARMSKILADSGIGIFAISTYDTDYIFVKEGDFENALTALKTAGYKVLGQKSEKKTFPEWVESLKQYDLSYDEHNLALMLLFFYKTAPEAFTQIALEELLKPDKSIDKAESTKEEKAEIYQKVRRYFTSSLTRERNQVGCNDTCTVASYAGRDSAANVLLKFREDEQRAAVRELFGETPNLGNVRRVDYKTVAGKPGKQYLKFLMDWYNSLG